MRCSAVRLARMASTHSAGSSRSSNGAGDQADHPLGPLHDADVTLDADQTPPGPCVADHHRADQPGHRHQRARARGACARRARRCRAARRGRSSGRSPSRETRRTASPVPRRAPASRRRRSHSARQQPGARRPSGGAPAMKAPAATKLTTRPMTRQVVGAQLQPEEHRGPPGRSTCRTRFAVAARALSDRLHQRLTPGRRGVLGGRGLVELAARAVVHVEGVEAPDRSRWRCARWRCRAPRHARVRVIR